ncbi:MAG: glycogen debranching protein GlgX [Aphanocapsa sp. GSE-SYN-MK-11-07L]|jgi:glycogen operon protein|nr:glycogen debranching protein GlgX [Aphanocapsa sp. GSE-SYN-MK-11-07L]
MSDVLPGQTYPLGATVQGDGVNFCLFSKGAAKIELLLFERPLDPQPSRVITLDAQRHKTYHYWHAFVPGIGAGQVYAYRAYGSFAPDQGLRFNSNKVLLDPYAQAVVGWENYSRPAAIAPFDNCPQALRSVVVDTSTYDWEGDVHPKIPYSKTIIHEIHVRGFTCDSNSGLAPEKRGTYAGLIEKIPYLQSLGITAVELMPIHEFDEQDARPGLKNYWGYSTIAFFAPHQAYSSRRDPLGAVDEFRDMVKALHRAGIEVILDVVFNHTAEGNDEGPTFSFKGLSNSDYYMLEEDLIHYRNYSGCGNTFQTNAIASALILDCLRYWATEMHVDGFRFDLASVLSRDSSGVPLKHPPLLWVINSDPKLAGIKLIAEAWDAAGLYQVGSFAGDRFAEWNGPFRDDVRRFVKGDPGMVKRLANRMIGSPDIYPQHDREPNHSINFVTCHDGFTLNDLVSYNRKHNQANGENSRDGANDNWSWNCGVEGSTDNPEIEALRLRQIKNFLTILFTAQGTPMMLMGDGVRRSQQGNNNAYCQDNELSWFDWSALDQQTDLLRFTKELIGLNNSLAVFSLEQILPVSDGGQTPHIVWHGTKLAKPDWGDGSHCLAFTLHHPTKDEHLHFIFNAYWQPLTFELPPLSGQHWHRIIDTDRPSPEDFCRPATAPLIQPGAYTVAARSTVVLMAA